MTSPVSIGWMGDVHSGTLTCNSCGWEQFTKSYEADDWEMQHRADHGEEASAYDSLDRVIREMTVSTSPANLTRTVGDGDIRAMFTTRPRLILRVLAERHPQLLPATMVRL